MCRRLFVNNFYFYLILKFTSSFNIYLRVCVLLFFCFAHVKKLLSFRRNFIEMNSRGWIWKNWVRETCLVCVCACQNILKVSACIYIRHAFDQDDINLLWRYYFYAFILLLQIFLYLCFFFVVFPQRSFGKKYDEKKTDENYLLSQYK